jgi:GNAT superfamily N-acetyltransferase
MEILYRRVNYENLCELKLMAEADARIPLAYDPSYIFAEASISARLDYYKELAEDDFFEVAAMESAVVGFHIIRRTAYPPNLYVGSVISLWVHPEFRRKGIAGNLKVRGEHWARSKSLMFLQTHVHVENKRMLEVNRSNGYEVADLNLRKVL